VGAVQRVRLPAFVGVGWAAAMRSAPAASLELMRALLLCVAEDEAAPPLAATAHVAWLSDETRLAAPMLVAQFGEHAASTLMSRGAPEGAPWRNVAGDVSSWPARIGGGAASGVPHGPLPSTPPQVRGHAGYSSPHTTAHADERDAVTRADEHRVAHADALLPPRTRARTRHEVVALIEEWAAASGVAPPCDLLVPLPRMNVGAQA
jgi:hypothetical protein